MLVQSLPKPCRTTLRKKQEPPFQYIHMGVDCHFFSRMPAALEIGTYLFPEREEEEESGLRAGMARTQEPP